MIKHSFTLVIEGGAESRLDELFEVGCDDATFGTVDGINYGEFDRYVTSFAEAVSSTIADVGSVEGLMVRRTKGMKV